MDIFDRILNHHNGDKVKAGIEVGFGLMRGDAASFKAGYTAPNAVLAVTDLYGLTEEEADRVASVLNPAGVKSVKED